jgi:hypothetical protein
MNLKQKIITSILLLLILIAVQSCKKSLSGNTSTVNTKERMLAYPDTSWQTLSRYPPYFSLKTKVDFNDGQTAMSFVANVRMRKDSLIWVSFTGPLGIEVIRSLIDRDSVKIWNKLSNERTTQPISSLSRFLPFTPTLFDIQDFLLGNPLLISTVKPAISNADILRIFTQDNVRYSIQHNIDMQNYTLSELLLKDKMEKQQMDATFESYERLQGYAFSKARNIKINRGDQKMDLALDIYKYGEVEKLDFPFW